MPDLQYDILEACIKAIETGENHQQVIARHPELQPEIEAALQANTLRNLEIPFETQQRSRSRILAHAADLRASQPAGGLIGRLPRLAIAVLLALFVFLTSSSLLIASARSLPGDQLYAVKRAVEDLRINLSSNPTSQLHIEEQYRQRRIEEIQQLLNRQRSERVSFDGIVSELGVRHWIVDGVTVIVAPETSILGKIEGGMLVEVEGITQPEGWVQASEIHLRAFEFSGRVESESNQEWIISGQKVQISPETQIDPEIQIGTLALVHVQADDDGRLRAVKITFLSPAPTATPVPTASPTETVKPTSTLISTDEPTPEALESGADDDREQESEDQSEDDDSKKGDASNDEEDEENEAPEDDGNQEDGEKGSDENEDQNHEEEPND